jgi:hypothetical protein
MPQKLDSGHAYHVQAIVAMLQLIYTSIKKILKYTQYHALTY